MTKRTYFWVALPVGFPHWGLNLSWFVNLGLLSYLLFQTMIYLGEKFHSDPYSLSVVSSIKKNIHRNKQNINLCIINCQVNKTGVTTSDLNLNKSQKQIYLALFGVAASPPCEGNMKYFILFLIISFVNCQLSVNNNEQMEDKNAGRSNKTTASSRLFTPYSSFDANLCVGKDMVRVGTVCIQVDK